MTPDQFTSALEAAAAHHREADNKLRELRAENTRLRAMIFQMGDRLLLMSQVLTRRAERKGS